MKRIILATVLVVLVSAGLVFSSCESKTYDEISEIVTNPTYSSNVKKVIDKNCISCHAGDSQYPNLENYEEVKSAIENDNLICKIDDLADCSGGIMPTSGRMPQSTIDMIKLWRDQGLIN